MFVHLNVQLEFQITMSREGKYFHTMFTIHVYLLKQSVVKARLRSLRTVGESASQDMCCVFCRHMPSHVLLVYIYIYFIFFKLVVLCQVRF